MPHPRHRWAVCDALGVDESMIWPEAVRRAIKTGPDREIAAAFPYRSSVPKSLWRSAIKNATGELTFAGYTNYFLWLEQPDLRGTLRRKAESGAGCASCSATRTRMSPGAVRPWRRCR